MLFTISPSLFAEICQCFCQAQRNIVSIPLPCHCTLARLEVHSRIVKVPCSPFSGGNNASLEPPEFSGKNSLENINSHTSGEIGECPSPSFFRLQVVRVVMSCLSGGCFLASPVPLRPKDTDKELQVADPTTAAWIRSFSKVKGPFG